GVATATAHFGPIYVFRNVVNRVRQRYDVPTDDGLHRGQGFKIHGLVSNHGGGRQYYFNNTMLQAPGSSAPRDQPAQRFPLGAGHGLGSSKGGEGMRETWTRNNMLHIWKNSWASVEVLSGGSDTNDLDYDTYNGGVDTGGFGPYEVNGYRFAFNASNP